jgi:putative cardiolipin synthase
MSEMNLKKLEMRNPARAEVTGLNLVSCAFFRRSASALGVRLLALLLASGCTQLKPLQLPAETALPMADGQFWEELENTRTGEWYHLLNTGDEALAWRLRLIDAATVSIDMDTFLWKPDVSGLEILAHLIAAADRGVRVRVLLDDSFTMHEDLMLHAVDEHPNISYRIYNPFRHRSDSAVLRQLLNLGDFPRINHRMHNKTLVVDGRLALVGGRNLADEYFGRHEQMNFRDMEVLAAGPQLPTVNAQFDGFWNSGWAFPVNMLVKTPDNAGDLDDLRESLAPQLAAVPAAVQFDETWRRLVAEAIPGEAEFYFDQPANHNPAEAAERPDQLAAKLRSLIANARSEVVLVTAYLVPTQELEQVVEAVENRGVRVKILTNSLQSNNHLAAHAAYHGHLRRLVDHGADLHEVKVDAQDRPLYMDAPVAEKQLGLHAKLLLIDDDLVFIGSCNLDPRSLKLNTEIGFIIRSRRFNELLRAQLAVDFDVANAWAVRTTDGGALQWVSTDQVLDHQPASSLFQRIEDWLVGLLPIDSQM